MGKRGNRMRQETRRSREAAILAQNYLKKLEEEGQEQTQEELELERAYGDAIKRAVLEETTVTKVEGKELVVVEDNTVGLRDRWRVMISEDHNLTYPDLALEVYVAGTIYEEPAFAEWLMRGTCRKAATLEEADLCIFTGGPDVDPAFYGARQHTTTSISVSRDNRDLEVYQYCYQNGVPMLGICRGAQFLHVMNGGKLYQDIDGHVGDHKIIDLEAHRVIDRISSTHHQSCIANLPDMKILATASISRKRTEYDQEKDLFLTRTGLKPDIEAFYYPESVCLGIQGHPEYKGYNAYSVWCMTLINRWIVENPDIDFVGQYRRLRPDLIGMRSLEKKGK